MTARSSRRFANAAPLDFRFLDLLFLMIIGLGGIAAVAILRGIGHADRGPLLIDTSVMTNGVVGQSYVYQLAASGGTAPYRWSVTGLPSGLASETTGFVKGTPSASGAFNATLAVQDQEGTQASKEITITTLDLGRVLPLRILTEEIPVAQANARYAVTFAAEGGILPYKWEFRELPTGMAAKGDTVSGTPTIATAHDVAVELRDARGVSARAEVLLRVLPTGVTSASTQAPLKVGTILPRAIVGEPYELQLAAIGGFPPYQWRLLSAQEGRSLSIEGLLRINSVADDQSPVYVRVFDRSNAYVNAELALPTVRPVAPWIKGTIVAAVAASWATFILLLALWTRHRPVSIRLRFADFSALLAIGFLISAFAVYSSGQLATLAFVVFVTGLGLWIFFNHRYA